MPGFMQRRSFQRIFVHNFWLKLVSLLLAVGLWLAVARDPTAEVEVRVPIEFQNLPDKLEIDSANSTSVQIRVRGPERLIHRLQPADVFPVRVAVVGNHLPRQCGIATFTTDLCDAIAAEYSAP